MRISSTNKRRSAKWQTKQKRRFIFQREEMDYGLMKTRRKTEFTKNMSMNNSVKCLAMILKECQKRPTGQFVHLLIRWFRT